MKKIVFYLSLFIISWAYCTKFNYIDWDIWARLTVGKIFFLTGTILQHDKFAYTPIKQLWIDHEWGSGVVFYTISHYFGDTGLMLLKIFISFAVLFLISRIIKLQNPKVNAYTNIIFYIIVYILLFSGLGSTIRCQHFTFLLFTLLIYLLEKIRRGENKLLFVIPPLMLVWTNLHGGFVAGLCILLTYGIGELLNKKPYKKYFIVLAISALVTLINPYTINYWIYMIQAVTMKRPNITEWRPTNLFGPLMEWKFYKLVLLLSIISIIFSFIKNRPKYKDLDKVKYLILALTLYMSLSHIKHQPFFGIAAGCFLYHDFYSIFTAIHDKIVSVFGEASDKILKNLAIIKDCIVFSIIIVAGSLLIYSNPIKITVPETMYPVGSIEFIRQNNISGNLVTLFHWGSYATWKLYPKCRIAFDGRYEEVYPDSTINKVRKFIYFYDKTSLAYLKKLNTDIVVMKKFNETSNTYNDMLNDNYWKLVYEDEISGVFIRADKAKQHYKEPVYTEESIIKDKYKSSITG